MVRKKGLKNKTVYCSNPYSVKRSIMIVSVA